MDVGGDMCELCSTNKEPVFLIKIESLNVCPKKECCYGLQLQALVHKIRDLGLHINLKKFPAVIENICGPLPAPVIKSSPKPASPIKNGGPTISNQKNAKAIQTNKNHTDAPEEEICIQSICQNDMQVVLNSQENVSNVVDIIEEVIADGICSVFHSFINWPDQETFCWLNSSLALLVHSNHIELCLKSKTSNDSHIAKVFSEYQSILLEINRASEGSAKIADVSRRLQGIRDCVFQFLRQSLNFSSGQVNSPAQVLACLLKENIEIKELFQFNHDWKLQCENCSAISYSSGIKTVIPFPEITEEFSLEQPWGLATCKKCLTPGQKRKLTFVSLPSVVIFHFEKGFTHQSIYDYDCNFQGQRYMVKGLVLCLNICQRKHFVTFIRDLRSNKWLNCEDCQPEFQVLSSEMPDFKSSDVHLIMWERVNEQYADEAVIKTPLKCRTDAPSDKKNKEAYILSLELQESSKSKIKPHVPVVASKSPRKVGKNTRKTSRNTSRKKCSSNSEEASDMPFSSDDAKPSSDGNSPIQFRSSSSETSLVVEPSKKEQCRMPRYPGIKFPSDQTSVLSDLTYKSNDDIKVFQEANRTKVVLEDCSQLKKHAFLNQMSPTSPNKNSQSSSPLKTALSTNSSPCHACEDGTLPSENLNATMLSDPDKVMPPNESQLQRSMKATPTIQMSKASSKSFNSIEEIKKSKPSTRKKRKKLFSTTNSQNKDDCQSMNIEADLKAISSPFKQPHKELVLVDEAGNKKENSETSKIETIVSQQCEGMDSEHDIHESNKKNMEDSSILDGVATSKLEEENCAKGNKLFNINSLNEANSNTNEKKGRKRKQKECVTSREPRPKRASARCYDLRKDPKVSEKGKVNTMSKDLESDWIEPPSEDGISNVSSKTESTSKRKRGRPARTSTLAKVKITSQRKSDSSSPEKTKTSKRRAKATKDLISQVNISMVSQRQTIQSTFGDRNSCTYSKNKISDGKNNAAESASQSLNIKALPTILGPQGNQTFCSPRIVGFPGAPRFSLINSQTLINANAIRFGNQLLPPGTRIQLPAGNQNTPIAGNFSPRFITLPSEMNCSPRSVMILQPIASNKDSKNAKQGPPTSPNKQGNVLPPGKVYVLQGLTGATSNSGLAISKEKELLNSHASSLKSSETNDVKKVIAMQLSPQKVPKESLYESTKVGEQKGSPEKAAHKNYENKLPESHLPASNVLAKADIRNVIALPPTTLAKTQTPNSLSSVTANMSSASIHSDLNSANGNGVLIAKKESQASKLSTKELSKANRITLISDVQQKTSLPVKKLHVPTSPQTSAPYLHQVNISEPGGTVIDNSKHSPKKKKVDVVSKTRVTSKSLPAHNEGIDVGSLEPTVTSLSKSGVSSTSPKKKVKDNASFSDESSEGDDALFEKILESSCSDSSPLHLSSDEKSSVAKNKNSAPLTKANYGRLEFSRSSLLSELFKKQKDEDSDEV